MAKLYAFLSLVYQNVVFKIAPENKNISFVFSELDKMLIQRERQEKRERKRKGRRREQERSYKGCLLQLPEAGLPHDPMQEPYHS